MPPIPDLTESVSDGALGFTGEPVSQIWGAVGVCSGGSTGTVYAFRDPSTVVATLGQGPLVEWLLLQLNAKRGLIYVVKVTASVAASSTVPSLTGTSPAMTLSVGTGFDNYDGKVQIVKGGAVGTSTFKYSLDGGDTWSPEIVTAATYAIPNSGLTLAFAAGTYVAGDYWTWTTTAPAYSTSDFNTAVQTLLDSGNAFAYLAQIGCPDGASDTLKVTAWAGFVSAVQSKLDTAFAGHRFVRAIVDPAKVPDDATTDALIQTALASVAAPRVMSCGSFIECLSPLTLRQYKRPETWIIAARIRSIPLGEDPAYVGRGSLPAACKSIYNDEAVRPARDALRLATLRRFQDLTGFFVTNANLLSAAGSDFKYWQHGAVIDEGLRLARQGILPQLSSSLRTYSASQLPSGKVAGELVDEDVTTLEREGNAKLATLVQAGACQSARVEIVRGQNNLSTQTINYKLRVKPLFYPKTITVEAGFEL